MENKQRLQYVFALIPSSVVRISLLSCVSYSLHTSYIHPYMQVPGLICHPFLRPNCCFRVTIQRDECQIDIWTDGYATLLGGTLLYRRMISVDILQSAPLCDASAMGTAWTASKNCRTFMVPISPFVWHRDMLRYLDTRRIPTVGIMWILITQLSIMHIAQHSQVFVRNLSHTGS